MEIIVRETYESLCQSAGAMVAELVRRKPDAVLGLATGSTPLGLYRELIRLHRDEGLDFSEVRTFNLDEYVGLPPGHPQGYHHFMWDNLLRHVNIAAANVRIPSGMERDYGEYCRRYERQIVESGGIDLQVLGIGVDGHIGFNEPSSSLGSRTRLKTLAQQTIRDNARFFDRAEEVPVHAVTMGVGTILEARQIVLLASGPSKAAAIAAAVEGPVTAMCTASALQLHRDATLLLDRPAAADLRMIDYYQWIQAQHSRLPNLDRPQWHSP